MNKDDLKKLIVSYLYRIVYANDKFCLYKYLCERKQDRLDEMNIAPGFFSTVFDALRQSFIIEVFKLYDIKSDTGLVKLLNICRNCYKTFPCKTYNEFHQIDIKTGETIYTLRDEVEINIIQDITQLKNKLSEKEGIINNLRGQRDKYYAHLDKKYFNDDLSISDDYPFSFNDVELLLDFAGEVCNTLLVDLCGEKVSPQSTNYNDIKYILDRLHNRN